MIAAHIGSDTPGHIDPVTVALYHDTVVKDLVTDPQRTRCENRNDALIGEAWTRDDVTLNDIVCDVRGGSATDANADTSVRPGDADAVADDPVGADGRARQCGNVDSRS